MAVLPRYVRDIVGKKVDPARVPERFTRHIRSWDMNSPRELSPITLPDEFLRNVGFPEAIASSDYVREPLAELDSIEWKPFMLLVGPYKTGKTTLAANFCYWRGYQDLTREEELRVSRVDTIEFTEVLVMASKSYKGLSSACDRYCGAEDAGERLQDKIEYSLSDACQLLIFDDINLDAITDDAQLKKLNQIIMNRFMANRATWLITNETTSMLYEKFPRVMSRVSGDPNWGTVRKKGPDGKAGTNSAVSSRANSAAKDVTDSTDEPEWPSIVA